MSHRARERYPVRNFATYYYAVTRGCGKASGVRRIGRSIDGGNT